MGFVKFYSKKWNKAMSKDSPKSNNNTVGYAITAKRSLKIEDLKKVFEK